MSGSPPRRTPIKTFPKRVWCGPLILGVVSLLDLSVPSILFHERPERIATAAVGGREPAHSQARLAYGRLPQNFIPNMGQLNPQVKFYEKGGGHAAFFTKGGVDLTLYNGDPSSVSHPVPNRLRLTPLGAQKNPEIVGEGLQKGRVNYLIGHDPRKWRTGLPIYQAVVYKEIYPGIDMKFYGGDRQLEYDIVVKPEADPSSIRLSFEGAKGLRLAENGDLRILIDGGEIVQKKPRVYQEIDGRRREVPGKFTLLRPQPAARGPKYIYGFDLASYDKNVPLVIDPTLVYSTYLGGSGDEHGYSIAVDASGLAYVSGFTTSADLVPSEYCAGVYDCSFNGGPSDAFVAKLDPSASGASSLRYLTYLGGSSKEDNGVVAGSIAVDASGDAYVTGVTSSADFPTTRNAYQSSHQGGFDAFVAKLDPTGSKLLYSTYLGGDRDDTGRSIAIDASGRAYVTGETNSTNLVPPRLCKAAYDCAFSGVSTDAFVAKLDPAGSGPASLQYVTYLGGSDLDVGFSIAVDAEGRADVTGETNSYDFPATPGAFDVTCGTDGFCDDGVTDVFVSKIDPSRPGAASLVYSTFLGGSGFDSSNPVNSIAVDRNGDVYVTGCTASEDYPTTPGAYMNRRAGGCDIFVTKLRPDPSGPTPDPSDLLYSTFLGGRSYDDAWGIAVDPAGIVYLTGFTWSKDYPVTPGAVSRKLAGGVGDAFVTVLKPDPSGPTPDPSDLLYSTYLGGGGADSAYGIAVDGSGRVYLAGETTSNNFPTSPGGFDRKYHGGYDAFVAELAFPDLVMSAVRLDSGKLDKGGVLSVTDTVQNRGTVSAENFQIGYRLSVNSIYGDSDDVVIKESRTIGSLAAGKSDTATTRLTLPASTPPNTYHICANADEANTVTEGDETNNTRCATATINVP